MKVLRLPWEEWGDTDIQLLMAADLHDRLVCSCGCGKWEADAHDPLKKHLWQVDTDVCYVRRALDEFVTLHEPSAETVLSIRLVTEAAGAKSEYEAIRERFPERFGLPAARQTDAAVDDADDDGQEQQQD